MGKVLQLFPEFEEDLQSNLSETERNLCEIVVGDANRVLLGFPEGLDVYKRQLLKGSMMRKTTAGMIVI